MSLNPDVNKLSGSVPNLSANTPEERSIRRKRLHDDDYNVAFEQFTEKITTILQDWKQDFNESTSQMKDTLKTLNENTEELKAQIVEIRKEYTEIRKSVRDLDLKGSDMQKDIISLKKSMQFFSEEHEDVSKKIGQFSKDIKSIDTLTSELAEVKMQYRKIKVELNANEQRDRALNIELIGVPETNNKDLIQMILKLGTYTGTEIPREDIIQVNRVSSGIKLQGRPRNIIAKLRHRLMKDNMISQARKSRMSSKDLDIQGKVTPIYVNEHLTMYNKYLLKETKDLAKSKEYQFTWTKNGRIYVRKAVTVPPILILEEEDLKKLT